MKKAAIFSATFILLAMASCTKNTEGSTSVIETDTNEITSSGLDSTTVNTQDSTTGTEYTERYVGEDGTSALVTFNNKEAEKNISIRSNNKTISAPQKEALDGGAVYGNFDIEITAKNDSIKIIQGNNVIQLRKARGQ